LSFTAPGRIKTTAGFGAGGAAASKVGGGVGVGEIVMPGPDVVATSRIDAATTRMGFMALSVV
jgi:hypothetical protein